MIFTYNLQKIELGILLALSTRLTSYGFASDSVLVEWLLILLFYLGNILNIRYIGAGAFLRLLSISVDI
jgi:hypothetical protein